MASRKAKPKRPKVVAGDVAQKAFGLLRGRHPDAHCELVHASPFELIVATVLSAQSTDVMVNKITPELFDIWMRLLKAVDGSVLWLLDDNPPAVRNLKREAEARRVIPQRLVFAPRKALEEHLARHRLADLFLDTLPCNAHTTASDALWAGLPVLTCTGNTFAGRVAASLLSAVGLPELIADSLPVYESLAMKLAHDPAALSALKTRLAATRDSATLFDTGRFTRHLESAYVMMWERAQHGLPAESFAVTAARP